MRKQFPLLIGPALFLLAEVLSPGGSSDPALRQSIIVSNQGAWELSHQIFIVAFASMIWWLMRLWATLAHHAPIRAGAGAFLSGFAILADLGIATLQLLALEVIRTLPPELALAVMTQMGSPNLMLFVFLPYLGFALGFGLLAAAMGSRANRGRWLPIVLLALAGTLLTTGGIAGSKILLSIAALALLVFTGRACLVYGGRRWRPDPSSDAPWGPWGRP
jgi:hypothetical protein